MLISIMSFFRCRIKYCWFSYGFRWIVLPLTIENLASMIDLYILPTLAYHHM